MGVAPTGNGRRESFAHLPMPRMTNTIMLAGDARSRRDHRVGDDGLYAANFGGGQVDITSGKFVFSAAEAWKIENGKLTYPVKGATLIGNGPDALTRVSMVGNDLRARHRRRHLRQGRAERAGRRRPADAAHRGDDGRRNAVTTPVEPAKPDRQAGEARSAACADDEGRGDRPRARRGAEGNVPGERSDRG